MILADHGLASGGTTSIYLFYDRRGQLLSAMGYFKTAYANIWLHKNAISSNNLPIMKIKFMWKFPSWPCIWNTKIGNYPRIFKAHLGLLNFRFLPNKSHFFTQKRQNYWKIMNIEVGQFFRGWIRCKWPVKSRDFVIIRGTIFKTSLKPLFWGRLYSLLIFSRWRMVFIVE